MGDFDEDQNLYQRSSKDFEGFSGGEPFEFCDFKRHMKALENARGTTSQTQVPIFGLGNLNTIIPNGQSIVMTLVLTPA
ncbi:hypothetical protein C1H46_028108 [Malus baccata]|uniref:Uncharacterized protein n=1 Tax=Malus baccata TaxID=106549 RepID=A0A540LIS1_MALBA|nr:hypothetical protein C1H46_028108 [Malus baccata]